MRKKIDLGMSSQDVLSIMSEGNPGALMVLGQLLKDPTTVQYIFGLDDMNIRGGQIWLGFKDVCKQDFTVFMEKIKTRDQGMVDYINNYMKNPLANCSEIAVTNGASFTR